jgi:HEAT repeat protein
MIAKWWRSWMASRRLKKLTGQTTSLDAGQRQQAAAGLAEFRDQRGAAAALVPLLNDAHTPVREAAASSLRAMGGAALPALLAGLKRSDDDAAAASAGLLGDLGDAAAVEPLIVALKFSARPVQLAAKRALIRLGAPAAEALRGEAADDAQPWLRQQVADVLEQVAVAGKAGPA